MYEFEPTLYKFACEYCRRLVVDIPQDKLNYQPVPGTNTPLWILGHLAIASDYVLKLLGHSIMAPKTWHVLFAPGSSPEKVPVDRAPTREELLAFLQESGPRLTDVVRKAQPDQLQQKHTIEMEFLKQHIPLVGDLIPHLMTTHIATHLGQLSMWRRLMGLPSVLT